MIIERKNKLSAYSMKIIDDNLIVTGEGMFTKDDAQNFINDFLIFIRINNIDNLNLIINNIKLKTCFPDVKPLLNKMFKIYTKSNFKKKYIVMPKNSIAGMQIKKCNNILLHKLIIISNINEMI